MTSLIKFSPLYGAYSEGPLCYLLEIDDFRFLLDCGWDERFNESLLVALRTVAPTIDAVLISHPDLEHLGALPYAVGKLGLNAPIYGTIPVFKMGQMFLYDAFQARNSTEDFEAFTLDDVDSVFDKFVQLKYSQHLRLQGKGAGIEITPYTAGHMLGGTIWRITKETDDIVYAVDYNHKKERHLNPTVLETLKRPMLLITDAYNATTNQQPRPQRDKELIESILTTLRGGGNVLIPTDTAGRTLELLMCLNQYWTTSRLHYPVIFLTNFAYRTIDFAKSQLEWMSDDVQDSFDNRRENPFDFQNIDLLHSLKELEEFEEPMVVLTSFSSLETGFSRELFLKWATDTRNMVIFTQRPPSNTLADTLYAKASRPRELQLSVKRKVPLEGQELEEYYIQKRKASEAQPIQENEAEETVPSTDEAPLEEMDLQAIAYSSINKFFQDGSFDLVVTPTTPAHPMYPCYETVLKYDEYGETIDPALYEAVDELEIPADDRQPDTDAMELENAPKEVVPTKCLVEQRVLSIQCQFVTIDFEGRSDARSIKAILNNVAPRKLILVHGSEKATNHLRQDCERALQRTCGMISAPQLGEWVDVTSEANVFKVRLKESLVSSLHFARLGEYSVAYLDGIIHKTTEGLPMLEEIPPNERPGHDALFMGDVRLSDFKQALARYDCPAELTKGHLVTNNGLVEIYKEESSGSEAVVIQGLLSEEFFKARSVLYDQFEIM